tara:strand:- start:30 stop:1250 length:1221 start_codon:yes stop_codon:yes gene_type:complete
MKLDKNKLSKTIDYSSLNHKTFTIKKSKSIYDFLNFPIPSLSVMLDDKNTRSNDFILIDEFEKEYECFFKQTRPSNPVWRIHYKNDFQEYLRDNVDNWKNIVQRSSSDFEIIFSKTSSENTFQIKIKKFEVFFEKGKTYKRSELHDNYGGDRQKGITNCVDYPIIFLFSNPSKKQDLYIDKKNDKLFYYSGEGVNGDMTMTKGNKSVWNHEENNKKLHLFESTKKTKSDGFWKYIGEMKLVDLEMYKSKDKKGFTRESFQFVLEENFNSEKNQKYKSFNKKSEIQNIYKSIKNTNNFSKSKEGRVLIKKHKYRERNGQLPILKKQKYFEEFGHLSCEVCQFNFSEKYGERGDGYIECHHNIPLSELKEDSFTKLSDLTLLCSNCHRMIHRTKEWLKIDELRKIIKT